MREPIPRDTPDALPQPKISLLPGARLKEPNERLLHDLALAIRAGARPRTAAAWLGVSAKTWKRWRSMPGGIFDRLRQVIRDSVAHLEVKLQADLAKKNPSAALKRLRRVSDEEVDDIEPSRPYHPSGVHTLKRALPHLLARVSDDTVTDLSAVEEAAKQWRTEMIDHLGGRDAITPPQRTLLNACCGSWLLLSTVDSFVMTLAETRGVVDKRHRRAYPIIETRARLADSLMRQLLALGLDRKTAPAQTLDAYVATKYGATNGHVASREEPA